MTPTHTDPDTGVRYLEPISYERVPEGWRVPDHERERWDNPPRHQAPRQQQQPEPGGNLVVPWRDPFPQPVILLSRALLVR